MRKPSTTLLITLAVSLLATSSGTTAAKAQVSVSAAAPPKAAKAAPAQAKASAAQSGPAAKPAPKADTPLLPSFFAGWQAKSDSKPITDPAAADAANAAALKEYGFTDALVNDYSRDGDSLHLKALRFDDASGAYGAYSYFRHSGWPKEDIGTGAASDKNRVLFWIGNVFVDATFSRVSPMSASELRELAKSIPLPAGNKALPPPILGNLPQSSVPINPDGPNPQTTHYALGPAGYVGPSGAADPLGVLPPQFIGFDRGAEVVTVNYKLRSGQATLTLIEYPTPQLATAQEKPIADYLKAGNSAQHPFTKPLQDSNPTVLEVRRSGPLLAVVSGDPIQQDAHKLLESVHYDAELATVPGQGTNEIKKTAQLLLGIVSMVVVMFIAAVLLAFFLGGGRALYRILRGRPVSSVYDEEFTSLDL